jgi:hypothetical protein
MLARVVIVVPENVSGATPIIVNDWPLTMID